MAKQKVDNNLINSYEVEVKQQADGSLRQVVEIASGFVPDSYDQADLTYVAAGNGAGEIDTVTYKKDGVAVATLTLTYNSDDNISSIVRT